VGGVVACRVVVPAVAVAYSPLRMFRLMARMQPVGCSVQAEACRVVVPAVAVAYSPLRMFRLMARMRPVGMRRAGCGLSGSDACRGCSGSSAPYASVHGPYAVRGCSVQAEAVGQGSVCKERPVKKDVELPAGRVGFVLVVRAGIAVEGGACGRESVSESVAKIRQRKSKNECLLTFFCAEP